MSDKLFSEILDLPDKVLNGDFVRSRLDPIHKVARLLKNHLGRNSDVVCFANQSQSR